MRSTKGLVHSACYLRGFAHYEIVGSAAKESVSMSASRRCDRRTPVCSRCAEKKVACVYRKSGTANRRGKYTRELTPCTEALSSGNPVPNIPGLSFDINYTENMPTGFLPDVEVESTSRFSYDTPSNSNIFTDTFLHLLDNNSPSSSDQWLITNEENHLVERPTTPADEEVVMAYQKMAACQKLDTWHAYEPKTPLYYILNRVREFTGEFATKNTTPFIHQYLYHNYKPQCIMVMRATSNNAHEFVVIEVSRVTSTPIEKLARSQVLLLYQTVRLFDGDITLRAQGERDMKLLKTWLSELWRIRENLGDSARLEYASAREQSPVEWENWIFSECVRRTIIIAYAVVGLYELLKDPGYRDPDNPWAYVHRWTLGRSLWEAGSATEFQRAWDENSHFVIANFTLENFIKNGKGEDVDEFAEIFLNVYMGVDAAREFMAPPTQGR
ncbi:hypothetical protein GGR58DRAFT_264854 [Xylaria digitata]|nr:hypothetical protein GGR58DRAFT_264854 [Xylaria digitata]